MIFFLYTENEPLDLSNKISMRLDEVKNEPIDLSYKTAMRLDKVKYEPTKKPKCDQLASTSNAMKRSEKNLGPTSFSVCMQINGPTAYEYYHNFSPEIVKPILSECWRAIDPAQKDILKAYAAQKKQRSLVPKINANWQMIFPSILILVQEIRLVFGIFMKNEKCISKKIGFLIHRLRFAVVYTLQKI